MDCRYFFTIATNFKRQNYYEKDTIKHGMYFLLMKKEKAMKLVTKNVDITYD